jgi:galactitol-specific phosphotransferase system IIB component
MIKFFAPSNTVAHLGGGNFDPGFCLAVVKFLEDKGIRVVNAHIDYTESNTNLSAIDALLASESLAIDARNGNLYSPVTFSIDMDLNKILKQVAEFKSDNSHSIPMKQIFNSLEMPAVKSKQAVVEEACSFHGLQAAFLPKKKPQAPVLQPNITKPASTDDSEPLFPGLRRGFLNNKPPVKSTNAPPQDGVQFRR